MVNFLNQFISNSVAGLSKFLGKGKFWNSAPLPEPISISSKQPESSAIPLQEFRITTGQISDVPTNGLTDLPIQISAPTPSIASVNGSSTSTIARPVVKPSNNRRRIASGSRDDILQPPVDIPKPDYSEEDDETWYTMDKLLKDHLREVLAKWEKIDDEIWAKIILFERNHRVAKVYARAPVLIVNGSVDAFDGLKIGLNGFENPVRDSETEDVLQLVEHGIKLKMDNEGNILVKRFSRNDVYLKTVAAGDNVHTTSKLEIDKAVPLFDMKNFTASMESELGRAYPDRRRLEIECVKAVAFVKQERELLSCPSWILVINLVAMEMLKAKWLPPMMSMSMPISTRVVRMINKLPPTPFAIENSPYESASGGDDQAGDDEPPKLPPRPSGTYISIPAPDYDA